MPAWVGGGQLKEISCEVRDFCLGGMLLAFDDSQRGLLSPLQQGDLLTVSLDVQGLRGLRRVSLGARLARKDGNQLGIAFEKPDPTSLLAVQNHVRELAEGQKQVATRSPATPEKSRLAAATLHAMVQDFCTSRLQQFLPAAIEALMASAEKAPTNEAQFPYLEGVRVLRQQGASLSRNFVSNTAKAIDDLLQQVDGAEADHRRLNGQLSLVDKEAFEDWLALKVMASRAEGQLNEELLHLQLRFDDLFAISLSTRRNPVHPSVFCTAFGEALRLLPLKQKTDRITLAAFEHAVIQQLGTLYRGINEALVRQGVLPDLDVGRYISEHYGRHAEESTAADVPDKPAVQQGEATEPAVETSVQEAAGEQQKPSTPEVEVGEASARPPTTAAAGQVETARPPSSHPGATLAARQFALQQHIAKHAYETVKRLLSSSSLHMARSARDGQIDAGNALPVPEQKLHQTLDDLQRTAVSEELAAMPLPERVHHALQGDQAEPLLLDNDTHAAVDVIHNLFAGILANPALSERVRLALRKLEVPFLRLLLNDDSFLEEDAHPARQMLNRIAHLGVRGSANLQAHEGEIDQEVAAILRDFNDDSSVFEVAVKNLDRLAERQQSLYLKNIKRVTEGCEGKQKIALARRHVGQELERRIGGKQVPRAVLSLIDAGWKQLLVQVRLRHGEDSSEWRQYMQVIDRMLLAVDHVPEQKELTAMLAAIKAGLGQVDHTQMQNARLISELRDLLSRKARSERPPDVIDVPAGLLDESAGLTEEERQEASSRWMRRAQRHDAGDWFSYFDNGQEQMVRLAWTDTEKQTFVFVNHQGMKVTEYSVAEFAARLSSSQMQQIDNLDAPAVDRGLENMVQRVYDQMAHQATHDDLCDLLNRREFERRLRQRLVAEEIRGSLFQFDVDQFKVINNLGGPEAGDELLKSLASKLQGRFSGALLARLGGDEFAIWLEGQSADEAQKLAEQFCRRISEEKFVCSGKPFSITLSCGMVHREGKLVSASELIRAADTACHAAKEAGRNRLQRYTTEDQEMVRRDDLMSWITRLNEAIESDRLLLRCQRIESTHPNGARPAYEVLISISGTDGEVVPPAEFMHAAERYNRMHAVDRWVVSNVLRWMHANPTVVAGLDHLSINLSGHSLNDNTLLEFLLDMFRRYPVNRGQVCFEVTETAAITNLEEAADFIRELQGLGCRFSLDDFGSGLASYGHLKHLPVDYIKIDGSFIRDVADDPADLALVRSINEMGHLMGKRTIAEYVENDRIRALMAEIGVDYVQGYGVEKPRPLDSLTTV
jgi:diguanylate cyclase (GGDEF)-like protein